MNNIHNVLKNYFKDLLGRYQQDQLNETEKKLLDSWYDSFNDPEASPLNNPLSRKRIQRQLANRLKAHMQPARIVKLRLWHYAAASVVLISLVSVLLITRKTAAPKPQGFVVRTEPGRLRELKLPDGSKIWLNAGSVLKFDPNTFLTQRVVYLEDGEAFFEVTKDKKHPFRVISPQITTLVYGTSFNVKTYKKLSYSTVNVRTGKVMVSSATQNFPDTLRANDVLIYNHSRHVFKKENSSAFDANSWIKGVTNIRDASFDELTLLFYNQFNVRLISRDKKTLNHHYSIIIFHDQPLDMTLKLICSIHHNHYRREQNAVTITP
ncbi:FecR family protein [Mucilaginibacter sp.]|uniref:FecR family protein n=1 Tax=Mucilaginibacter sp. TaxID=1882438 RepID=UPI00260A9CF5|nr:FecR family protein [Mucilaginibacter sp.]MDB4924226.1 hypothetical protein [Mucilaginibacter sp.]